VRRQWLLDGGLMEMIEMMRYQLSILQLCVLNLFGCCIFSVAALGNISESLRINNQTSKVLDSRPCVFV
jgi:hypothetical protein